MSDAATQTNKHVLLAHLILVCSYKDRHRLTRRLFHGRMYLPQVVRPSGCTLFLNVVFSGYCISHDSTCHAHSSTYTLLRPTFVQMPLFIRCLDDGV